MSIGRVPGATGIQPSIVDAKGDLIVATAADSVSRLAVGANNYVLTADSAEATGVKWAAASSTPTFVGARATPTVDQSISNATSTNINLAGETYDTDGFHSTTTNTSRMTIPAGKGGYYLVVAKIAYADNTTGQRQIRIKKNGTDVEFSNYAPATAGKTIGTATAILSCVATDYIEMAAYQTSGGALNTDGGGDATSLTIQYLGA